MPALDKCTARWGGSDDGKLDWVITKRGEHIQAGEDGMRNPHSKVKGLKEQLIAHAGSKIKGKSPADVLPDDLMPDLGSAALNIAKHLADPRYPTTTSGND